VTREARGKEEGTRITRTGESPGTGTREARGKRERSGEMAREKVKTATTIRDWQEADGTLRKIRELKAEVQKKELAATDKIENIKAQLQMATAKQVGERNALEHDLEAFAILHQDEIKEETKGNKSIQLAHGKLGFRISTKLRVISKVDLVIALLKARKLKDFIREKFEINKEAMKDLDDQSLLELGMRREKEDVFWYELEETGAKKMPG